MPTTYLWIKTIVAVLVAGLVSGIAAAASTLWNWSYSAAGISASGTFTTDDLPDGDGGFLITAITGARNGSLITGLQPTGTAIPGNEPYLVDNLVFLRPGQQLTKDGFGFSTADGTFANTFFADFLPTPAYLEFFSTPPFAGGQGPDDSELPVQFSASPVPEPATFAVFITAVAFGGVWRTLRKAAGRQ
jgi:hypothetical protein